MRFKKKYFKEYKPISDYRDNLEELVNLDGGEIEGDYTQTNDSQIQTGPVNKPFNDISDFIKGLPTTTNKLAQYVNPRNWWTLYLKGFGGRTGAGRVFEDSEHVEMNEEATEAIKKLVRELLNKRNLDLDLVDRVGSSDINQTPNLSTLNPEVSSSVNDLVTKLNSGDISSSDRDMIIKFINQSLKK